MSPQILYEAQGALATLTLNRPQARNALSDEMIEGLIEGLDRAEAAAEVRCVLLKANGPAFCAGGDLKQMRDQEGMFAGDSAALRGRYVRGLQRLPRRFALFDKPVLAVIEGPAIGAGLDLACMCDIRFATPSATFGSTFVRVGLVPGDGGAYLLARAIGFPHALELMLTGRVIEVEEAARLGLVHKVDEDAAAAARVHAGLIINNAPLAVQLTKRGAYRSWDTELETALELAATFQGIAQRTEDHAEAVSALLERRDPDFSGR
ncbi:enoyl-CoA hydratase/isomerase family protein [Myxococcota bacterium]|nr:enoyl-CoA hydratase/isomerase family protein [Myxococcota bacterium]MBU1430429.1 enoyl-CoA hydratase/isomerase family protein [Myxococcota bacterium]MBU1896879.1 enoyl-CoA hydratase/isomerase family protein [Myxococcota bacterium]